MGNNWRSDDRRDSGEKFEKFTKKKGKPEEFRKDDARKINKPHRGKDRDEEDDQRN